MTELKKLLMQVAEGEITTEDAELKLKMQPFEDMGFAKPLQLQGNCFCMDKKVS